MTVVDVPIGRIVGLDALLQGGQDLEKDCPYDPISILSQASHNLIE